MYGLSPCSHRASHCLSRTSLTLATMHLCAKMSWLFEVMTKSGWRFALLNMSIRKCGPWKKPCTGLAAEIFTTGAPSVMCVTCRLLVSHFLTSGRSFTRVSSASGTSSATEIMRMSKSIKIWPNVWLPCMFAVQVLSCQTHHETSTIFMPQKRGQCEATTKTTCCMDNVQGCHCNASAPTNRQNTRC